MSWLERWPASPPWIITDGRKQYTFFVWSRAVDTAIAAADITGTRWRVYRDPEVPV